MGLFEGGELGCFVGFRDGNGEGSTVGLFEGLELGCFVVGFFVGCRVGFDVRREDGCIVPDGIWHRRSSWSIRTCSCSRGRGRHGRRCRSHTHRQIKI